MNADYITIATREAVAARAAPPEPWPETPRVPGPEEPDALPVDVLPPVLRDMALTTAGATQAPLDAAIGAAIGGISVAMVGQALVEICPRREWRKPVHTYVLLELGSGVGKSPLLNFPRAPIAAWEARRAGEVSASRRYAEESVKVAEDRLKLARREAAAKPGAESEGRLRSALGELARAEAVPSGAFQLLISDATEEEVVRVLAANEGRAASVDPEGTILEVAAGRYGNGDARLAALAHGWDGEAMRVNRVTRARVDVPSANLALLLGIQPGILAKMLNAETMAQRGIFARFLCFAPTICWDEIRTGREVPALDRQAVDRYARAVTRILDHSIKSDLSEGPHVLKMSPEAQEGVYRLERAKVDGMRPGGPLASVPAFAGKLPDHGARLAALLTVADRADTGEELFSAPIPGWAMEAAEALVLAIATHVVKVTGEGGGDPLLIDMEYLLDLSRELDGETESDIRERARARSRFRDGDHARKIFDHLEERGCIRRVPQEAGAGPGRPPSPVIRVHPKLRAPRPSDLSDQYTSGPLEGSDISDKYPPEERERNKSDLSEAEPGPESLDDLDEEDRQYMEDERLGIQEEALL